MTDRTYWATAAGDTIGDRLIEKVQSYFRFLQQSGRLALYRRAYMMYYSPALQGAQVNFNGEQGELVQITVNDFRSLLKRVLTLTTSQRPSFECRASNTDHKSDAQCILGQGLVDYYLREKKLEVFLKNATELALIFAEGFLSVLWDSSKGEQFGTDPETGAVIYQGDIGFRAFSPMEYVRDFSKESALDHAWGITVTKTNKYELAAKYPELADTIVKLDPTPDVFDGVDVFADYWRQLSWQIESDEIPTFEFYHRPTDALPQGRMVSFLSDATVLFDGPIPYKDVPIYRVSCAEMLRTPFGYSTGFDLMPVQEMTDSLHSTVCTNQNAFGVQNIWCPPGMAPDVTNIAGGMRLLQTPVKPEALQLTSTAAECFTYLKALDDKKQQLANLNDVAVGNPQRDMSGSAMALLASQAVQFNGDLQQSYTSLFEDCGSALLERLRVFGKVPRIAAIVGKSNQKYMKEFVGDDISEVNRVLCDQGNPIMNTTAGKMDLADKFLDKGLITTPEQYIMVYSTGRSEPIYTNIQSALMLIKEENEMLSEGINPPVLMTDNPLLHIKEHQEVSSSNEARNNPQIMQAYTMHLQQHIDLWRTMDPDLANMLGIPPPPPINMLGAGVPPQPGQSPPPQQQPAPLGEQSPTQAARVGVDMDASNPISQKASKVKLPKKPGLPKNAPIEAQAASQGQM